MLKKVLTAVLQTLRQFDEDPEIEGVIQSWENEEDQLVKAECPVHHAVHGAEAEHLRKGIEKVIRDLDGDDVDIPSAKNDLQRLLDVTDSADSLRHLELLDKAKGLVRKIEGILTRPMNEKLDPMPHVVKELKWQGWSLAINYISSQMLAKMSTTNHLIIEASLYQGLVNLMASYRYTSIFDKALLAKEKEEAQHEAKET